jgi:hypothetical protein
MGFLSRLESPEGPGLDTGDFWSSENAGDEYPDAKDTRDADEERSREDFNTEDKLLILPLGAALDCC